MTRLTTNSIPRWAYGVCVLLALPLGSVPVFAQGLTTASDESRLWLLLPEPDRPGVFTVLHHARADAATHIDRVQTLRGEVRPQGVSAQGQTLWIIYTDGTVQTIRAMPKILEDGWDFARRVKPSLPRGANVRAMSVTRTGPWALVRIEDRKVLAAIDRLAQPQARDDRKNLSRRRRNLAIGLPPSHGVTERPQQKQPQSPTPARPDLQTADPGTEPGTHGLEDIPISIALPVDRLLHLTQGRWQTSALPKDWPHGTEAWLVCDRENDDRPTLAARKQIADASKPGTIEVFHANPDGPEPWSHRSYELPVEDGIDGVKLIDVEDQLVLAQYRQERDQVVAGLWVLRGGKALRVGKMRLDHVSPTEWSIQGFGNTAALIAQRPRTGAADAGQSAAEPYRFTWTLMNVRGETLLEPTDMAVKTRGPMDDLAQYVMLAFVGILVVVLMMAFWRRDASWNRLDLPPGVAVADLGHRFIAAAIDMAPGLLATMAYFGLSIEGLLLRWPGNGVAHTAEQMIPGAVVVAVFVTHTTLSELVIARTLGKALTGLRTATLTGTRPLAWQLLVRGLLKTLDLLPWAWLLLMLPVIAPHRQRLGDLVGRTVVVTDAPPQTSDEEGDADDSA